LLLLLLFYRILTDPQSNQSTIHPAAIHCALIPYPFVKMGYVKKLGLKERLRSLSLPRRGKQRESSQYQSKNNAREPIIWEFHVTSNPKEYTGDTIEKKTIRTCATTDTVSTSKSIGQTQDIDANSTTTTAQLGWGWLLFSCWSGSPSNLNTVDDVSFESSDGTGDYSEPSMSRIDQVLECDMKSIKADDISGVTSAASVDTDDSDECESEVSHGSGTESNYGP